MKLYYFLVLCFIFVLAYGDGYFQQQQYTEPPINQPSGNAANITLDEKYVDLPHFQSKLASTRSNPEELKKFIESITDAHQTLTDEYNRVMNEAHSSSAQWKRQIEQLAQIKEQAENQYRLAGDIGLKNSTLDQNAHPMHNTDSNPSTQGYPGVLSGFFNRPKQVPQESVTVQATSEQVPQESVTVQATSEQRSFPDNTNIDSALPNNEREGKVNSALTEIYQGPSIIGGEVQDTIVPAGIETLPSPQASAGLPLPLRKRRQAVKSEKSEEHHTSSSSSGDKDTGLLGGLFGKSDDFAKEEHHSSSETSKSRQRRGETINSEKNEEHLSTLRNPKSDKTTGLLVNSDSVEEHHSSSRTSDGEAPGLFSASIGKSDDAKVNEEHHSSSRTSDGEDYGIDGAAKEEHHISSKMGKTRGRRQLDETFLDRLIRKLE